MLISVQSSDNDQKQTYNIANVLCRAIKQNQEYPKKQTWVLSLYVIKSKVPSGGMKDIVLSFSNRAKRTHLKGIEQTLKNNSINKSTQEKLELKIAS